MLMSPTHKKAKHKEPKAQKTGQQQSKTWLQKAWHFVWYDDSPLSWVATLVLAFILIKFIVYPLLALVFGTGLPIVAVISSSMDHNTNDFERWWDSLTARCRSAIHCLQAEWYMERGITKEQFLDFPLHKGFKRGDVIVLAGLDPADVEVGDVIVYEVNRNPLITNQSFPIIHRVVAVNEINGTYVYATKGDGNRDQIVELCPNEPCLIETAIPDSALVGKAVARVPLIGHVKLIAVDFFSLLGVGLR